MNTEPVRTRDPEGTKRQVLDAAEVLFAARGFAGTSIRDIAAASGVSHPLIQHHFATKEGLYRAVFRRCGEEYTTRFPDADDPTDQPIDLGRELTRIFHFIRDRDRLTRMVNWARLEGRADLIPEQNHPREAMIRRIAAGQAAGAIRTDIAAPTLAVILDALVFHWLDNRAAGTPFLPEPRITDEEYLAQAILVLQRGAAPREGSSAFDRMD